MNRQILITGAAGFLGSHLCDRFLKEEFSVIGVDNLCTGSVNNIEHLRSNIQFKFIDQDVCRKLHVSEDLDYILHFASPASPMDYLKMPIETLRVGSFGTHQMLELAKAKNARILVASTSEVYGDPLEHPQHENYYGNVNPVGPRGVYDEAKRYLEAITMAYSSHYGLATRIVRIFNTYGERMRVDDGRAVPTFISQALRNEDITIFGDGLQTRSFCFINDTVEGIFKLLFSDFVNPMNIGNPEEISIITLVKEIIALTNSKSELSFQKLPESDPLRRRPDISLAKEILDWEPKVDRKEGLIRAIRYFQKRLELD